MLASGTLAGRAPVASPMPRNQAMTASVQWTDTGMPVTLPRRRNPRIGVEVLLSNGIGWSLRSHPPSQAGTPGPEGRDDGGAVAGLLPFWHEQV